MPKGKVKGRRLTFTLRTDNRPIPIPLAPRKTDSTQQKKMLGKGTNRGLMLNQGTSQFFVKNKIISHVKGHRLILEPPCHFHRKTTVV
ncbi:hypothetical protein Hanom_Chr16g01473601 [Helianthus anomalus]